MVYQTAPFLMTLNDPKPRFQGQILSDLFNVFDVEYLWNG